MYRTIMAAWQYSVIPVLVCSRDSIANTMRAYACAHVADTKRTGLRSKRVRVLAHVTSSLLFIRTARDCLCVSNFDVSTNLPLASCRHVSTAVLFNVPKCSRYATL